MPYRNPFQGVTDLFSEFHRAREVGLHGRDVAAQDRQRTHASAWVPTTDIFVLDGRLVIRVELAGVDPEDVDLRFANGLLTVSGTRTEDFGDGEPAFYVRERYYGEFRRSITLPDGTRSDQISARFDDGLVEIVVEGVDPEADTSRIELRDRSGAPTTRRLG